MTVGKSHCTWFLQEWIVTPHSFTKIICIDFKHFSADKFPRICKELSNDECKSLVQSPHDQVVTRDSSMVHQTFFFLDFIFPSPCYSATPIPYFGSLFACAVFFLLLPFQLATIFKNFAKIPDQISPRDNWKFIFLRFHSRIDVSSGLQAMRICRLTSWLVLS